MGSNYSDPSRLEAGRLDSGMRDSGVRDSGMRDSGVRDSGISRAEASRMSGATSRFGDPSTWDDNGRLDDNITRGDTGAARPKFTFGKSHRYGQLNNSG